MAGRFLLLCTLLGAALGSVRATPSRLLAALREADDSRLAEIRTRVERFRTELGPLVVKSSGRADLALDVNVTCTRRTICDMDIFCREVCVPGSVEIPAVLSEAVRTQLALQLDLPLNEVQLMGTHNSAITYATGLGLEDVFLTNLARILWPECVGRPGPRCRGAVMAPSPVRRRPVCRV